MTNSELNNVPFNQILGTASKNVPAFSNRSDEFFSLERHYVHGVFMGIKWQCVEYARRWLLLRKGCTFKNVRFAADIWTKLMSVERVMDGRHFALETHPNGSPDKPISDAFLIYSQSTEQPVGHIAIICEVGPDYVRIAEQNHEFHSWPGSYAREIPLKIKDGLYYIEDKDEIYGWMTIEDNHELRPLDEYDIKAILKKYQEPQPAGTMERCLIQINCHDRKNSWLNKDDPAEKYFMDHYGENLQRANDSPHDLPYYKISPDFLLNIGTVTNELHRMFMDATNHVINNDELLTHFNIPKIFWRPIRQSWAHHKNDFLSGRFDFAFDDKQLKAFEYNADSASALFECAIIQKKWAEAVGLSSTFMSGWRLHSSLVNNWKRLQVTSPVHVLIDNDEDEIQTGLYMQSILKEIGIQSKLCVLLKDFHWKDSNIVDNDGDIVTTVWKLWMWETVIQDYLDVASQRGINIGNPDESIHQWKPVDNESPKLCDILLHEKILVIEPLWKVITSNKALLPILWNMYPNHPNLLRTEWSLTDNLKQMSYVKKPIVGRCGQNVTLYRTSGESIIEENSGTFSKRDHVYQEMFPLKNHSGYYPIIGSWSIHGHFAGFCIREDTKLITSADSPVTACCIVWEEEN